MLRAYLSSNRMWGSADLQYVALPHGDCRLELAVHDDDLLREAVRSCALYTDVPVVEHNRRLCTRRRFRLSMHSSAGLSFSRHISRAKRDGTVASAKSIQTQRLKTQATMLH